MEEEDEELVEEQSTMEDDDGEDEEGGGGGEVEGGNPSEEAREWETLARDWLAKLLAESRPVTMTEVEEWVSSNMSSLPDDLRSLSQSELLGRFSAIQSSLLHQQQVLSFSLPSLISNFH